MVNKSLRLFISIFAEVNKLISAASDDFALLCNFSNERLYFIYLIMAGR